MTEEEVKKIKESMKKVEKDMKSISNSIDKLYDKRNRLSQKYIGLRDQLKLEELSKYHSGDCYLILDKNHTYHYTPIKLYRIVGTNSNDISVISYELHYDDSWHSSIVRNKSTYPASMKEEKAKKISEEEFINLRDKIVNLEINYTYVQQLEGKRNGK